MTYILYESRTIFRQIFTDGRPLPKDPNPTWQGYSIGHWDGDTFEVETSGFNGKGWLDTNGHPVTDALHVIERYHRKDFGHMDVQITIDDPRPTPSRGPSPKARSTSPIRNCSNTSAKRIIAMSGILSGSNMRLVNCAVWLPLLALAAFGQPATITGTVSDPLGAAIENAPVQAKNAATGDVYRAVASRAGVYTFTNLPAGTYDISVNVAGLRPLERKAVAADAAKTLRVDIRLEDTPNWAPSVKTAWPSPPPKAARSSLRADAPYRRWQARFLRGVVVSHDRRPRQTGMASLGRGDG